MIHKNTFKKVDFSGAKGLVFIDDKILAYRRDAKTKVSPGCIDLPGGGREGNESPFETFEREVREEFGIQITQEQIIASFNQDSLIHPGTQSFFLVAKTSGIQARDIVFGDEGIEWMLLSPEEFIDRIDGIERQQKRVQKYLLERVVSG